jgi:protease-4
MLDINFPGIGWGKAYELREAIADFKQSGKPVYAYMEIGMNKEYYIATAADKVFLPPPGDLYVNGFAAEAMFYKGSLDKLGIEAEVIQIGPKYKNAPDQYTKKEMGEGQREVINAVLDEYWAKYTGAIAYCRDTQEERRRRRRHHRQRSVQRDAGKRTGFDRRSTLRRTGLRRISQGSRLQRRRQGPNDPYLAVSRYPVRFARP